MRKLARLLIERLFNFLHYKYHLKLKDYLLLPKDKLNYAADNLYTYNNASFKETSHFKDLYNEVKRVDDGKILSSVDIEWRIHVMCWAASHCIHLQGDFVECGVNTGMFAKAVISKTKFENTEKNYFLLDTFKGLDDKYSTDEELLAGKNLGYGKDQFLFDKVSKTFEKWNCTIIKGAIPETLSQIDTDQIAYACIDLNSVLPEYESLLYIWPRLTIGGMVVLDDYANPGRERQQEAHDRFARSVETEVLSLPTGQGLLIKSKAIGSNL